MNILYTILLIMLFVGILILKQFLKPGANKKNSRSKFKTSFINNTKLPKHQKVNSLYFYNEFISKTNKSEQIYNKKCDDIFTFKL